MQYMIKLFFCDLKFKSYLVFKHVLEISLKIRMKILLIHPNITCVIMNMVIVSTININDLIIK